MISFPPAPPPPAAPLLVAAAQARWKGAVPRACDVYQGRPQVRWHQLPPDDPSFMRSGECDIAWHWPDRDDLQIVCQAVIHEYGHLLGYGHSTDRRSIMYPELWLMPLPSICRRFTPAL